MNEEMPPVAQPQPRARASARQQDQASGAAAAAASVPAASSSSWDSASPSASPSPSPPPRKIKQTARRGGGGRAMLPLRPLTPEEVAHQEAALRAIQADDPHELQRLLRPTVADRYPREDWLKLTPNQLVECVNAFDFAALGYEAFDLKDYEATTLLHLAAAYESIPCMRVMLRNGCDINIGDRNRTPPLDELAHNGYLEGIDFLLAEGADPTLKSIDGSTMLHTACAQSTPAVVEKFLAINMELDFQDKDGFSAIFWTLDNTDKRAGVAIAHMLVQAGARVDLQDKAGSNIVMWGLSKVLEYYDIYCASRDKFEPEEVVLAHYHASIDRLPMLEYLLTLEGVDLSAEAHWISKDQERESGDPFNLVQRFIINDRLAQKRLMKEGLEQKIKDQKEDIKRAQKALAKKAGPTKKKSRGYAYEPLTEEAATPAADSPASLEESSPRKRARTTQPAASKKKIKLEDGDERKDDSTYPSDTEQDSTDTPMTDVSSLPPLPAASPSPPPIVESAATPSKPARRYILRQDHFDRPRLGVSDCQICQDLYPEEEIPEMCLRLVYMELLRRATNHGDWGDAQEVARLLKMRKEPAHPFLAKTLRYHQHELLPRRAGPSHIACSYEDEGSFELRILKQLLSDGIEDVTYNADGYNALQLVCELGDVQAVKQLLKVKFDINSTGVNSDAYTPLMLCCDSQESGAAIAAALLAAGAKLTTRDKFQNTAFQWAIYKGNHRVLKVLMQHCAAKPPAASSKLHAHVAPSTNRLKGKLANLSAPESLLEIDPYTWPNHWGNTIMHYACYKAFKSEGHFECLNMLLRHDVKIDRPPNHSGLVPRQVVAGSHAKHLRGKRVLVLLNSKELKNRIDEPRGVEIAALTAKIAALEKPIWRLMARESQESESSSTSKSSQAAQDRIQLSKLRKEFRPLEEELKALLEKSRLELEQHLGKLSKELLQLHWTPKKARGASNIDPHSAAMAAFSSGPTAAAISYPMPFVQDDISRGREWTKIRLENKIDTSGGIGYRYITHCMPHPDFSFPLPLAQGADYDANKDGSASGTQVHLTQQQLVERTKREAKQRKNEFDKAAKESKRKQGANNKAPAAPAPVRTSTFRKLTGTATGPAPRCDCTGPNACMDGSCPCFRKYTEKQLSTSSMNATPNSGNNLSANAVAAAASSAPGAASAAAGVARMAKLCTRIEQLCNCHELCGCRIECTNRHIAGGIRVKLLVSKTEDKGWACYADEFIPRGTFICEYVGEIVPPKVAAERLIEYDKAGVHYVFGFQESDVCIDPVKFGNVARTINHSCAPNLTKIQIYASDMRAGKRFPKMAFFAAQDIKQGEELAISYDYEDQEHPGGCLVCYCEADTCKHTLV